MSRFTSTDPRVFRTHQGIVVRLRDITTPYEIVTIRNYPHIRYVGVGKNSETLYAYPLFPNLETLRKHMKDQLKRKSKVRTILKIKLFIEENGDDDMLVATSEDELLWNQVLGYIINEGWDHEKGPSTPKNRT